MKTRSARTAALAACLAASMAVSADTRLGNTAYMNLAKDCTSAHDNDTVWMS